MLKQINFLKNNSCLPFKVIGISTLLIWQIVCFSGEGNKAVVLAAPTEEPLPEQNREPAKHTDKYLTQDQVNDIPKLIERYQRATKEEKETARQTFDASQEEYQKERFIVSGEGFVESVIVYPTVEALIMAGESLARPNITDQSENERRRIKQNQLKDAVVFFATAKEFAVKTSQTDNLKKYPALDERINCLKSFLELKADRGKVCEYVKDILQKNNIK